MSEIENDFIETVDGQKITRKEFMAESPPEANQSDWQDFQIYVRIQKDTKERFERIQLKDKVARANYLGVPAAFNLNHECKQIFDAFGHMPFLVGSCITKRDFRDVDLRLILPDDEFKELFPSGIKTLQFDGRWSLLCVVISEWLSARTGLPIDFQFQKMTDANKQYPNEERQPLGFSLKQDKDR